MSWTVGRLTDAAGGQLVCGDPQTPLRSVSTDTRGLQPGDCFVALLGESHDGHNFIPDALAKHVGALVVSRQGLPSGFPIPENVAVIRVADTLYALGELARNWRLQHDIPVAGITGSNGKTSTKEMLAGILSRSKVVLKTQGNFNNLIGAPLTLLSLGPQHRAAVVEMGINVPGEMARLAEICKPTVGLITNVHPAHLEGLKSVEAILEEKGRLWHSLGTEDLAVVNLDDALLRELGKTLECRTVTYSISDPSAQVRPAGDVETGRDGSSFRLTLGREEISIRLPVMGLHQVQNALAAAAAAWGMGEPPDAIAEALRSHQPVRQRMQVHRLEDGRLLIDDTYNANPRSVLAAVQAVSSASGGGPIAAVLGEMRELGPESGKLHHDLGRRIVALGVVQLVTLGDLAREIARGAMDGGLDPSSCFHAPSHEAAVEWLRGHKREGGWVLVKGSRAMAMERVVEGILAR